MSCSSAQTTYSSSMPALKGAGGGLQRMFKPVDREAAAIAFQQIEVGHDPVNMAFREHRVGGDDLLPVFRRGVGERREAGPAHRLFVADVVVRHGFEIVGHGNHLFLQSCGECDLPLPAWQFGGNDPLRIASDRRPRMIARTPRREEAAAELRRWRRKSALCSSTRCCRPAATGPPLHRNAGRSANAKPRTGSRFERRTPA